MKKTKKSNRQQFFGAGDGDGDGSGWVDVPTPLQPKASKCVIM